MAVYIGSSQVSVNISDGAVYLLCPEGVRLLVTSDSNELLDSNSLYLTTSNSNSFGGE